MIKNLFAMDGDLFDGYGCPRFESLQAYADKKLSATDSLLVEKHLKKCSMCADALEGLSGCNNNDFEKIDSEIESRVNKHKKIKIVPLFTAVAAVASVAAAVLIFDFNKPDDQDQSLAESYQDAKDSVFIDINGVESGVNVSDNSRLVKNDENSVGQTKQVIVDNDVSRGSDNVSDSRVFTLIMKPDKDFIANEGASAYKEYIRNNFTVAKMAFEDIINSDPHNGNAYKYLALCNFQSGYYQIALSGFNTISSKTSDYEITYYKALCYLNLGDTAKAVNYLNIVSKNKSRFQISASQKLDSLKN